MSQQINLINPLFLRQKKYFSVAAMGQGLVLLAIGVALANAFVVMERGNLAKQAQETGRQHKVQMERFSKLSMELSPDRAEQELSARLQAAEKELTARRNALEQLSSGTSEVAMGYSPFLKAFARQTVSGLWLTAIHVEAGGRQLTVRGRATQAELLPVYIQQLGRESVLKGRPFERLELARRELSGNGNTAFVEFALLSASGTGLLQAPALAQSGSARP